MFGPNVDDAIYISLKGAGASLAVLEALVEEICDFLSEAEAENIKILEKKSNGKLAEEFTGHAFIEYYTPEEWYRELGKDPMEDMLEPEEKLEKLREAFLESDELAFYLAAEKEKGSMYLDENDNIVIEVPYAP